MFLFNVKHSIWRFKMKPWDAGSSFSLALIITSFVSLVFFKFKHHILALFCVGSYLMSLAVSMFIQGVGTSPGGKSRVGKINTMNAGVGAIRTSTTPAAGSIGRRSTISYDQAKTSSSTERTNDVPRYKKKNNFLKIIYTNFL